MTRLALCLALSLSLSLASAAHAQSVRYRRPYVQTYRLNYGFDHDGGGGGCTDYACGGTCYDGHHGSDLGAPFGTTVLAAESGVVTSRNDGCASYGGLGNTCGGGCGNYVRIRHDDGSTSLYCHMQLGSIRVSTGQHVSCGEPIGVSASSGNSSGPHLHFGHISPGTSAASDPWAGGCSRATSLWVDQGPYRGPPSPACSGPTCAPTAESCNGRDEDCDGRIDEDLRRRCGTDVGECVSGTETCAGGSWSACAGGVDPVPERCDRRDEDCDGVVDDEQVCERDEVLWGAPVYGTSSGAHTDVDGDGRADACAMQPGGFACVTSSAHGFERVLAGGFDVELARASTIRMGDVDGDGRDDACVIESGAFVCRRSTGLAFDRALPGPPAGAATNVDLVDVDGDGRLDACARDTGGLACRLSDGRGLDRIVVLPELADDAGFADIVHWGSIRFGDLDGDGRADVCARDAEGLDCWHGEGDRFGERVRGPRWSDASGFDALSRWSTLRLADVDGDGRDDACIRAPGGFVCARSLGRAFGELVPGPAMDGPAWDRPDGYATLRMADVDGDGRADACARDGERLRCWISTGRAFDRVLEGPALRDADGFTDASVRFRSLRLADVDGDGRADACARWADGLRCVLATGHGFERTWIVPAWSDAGDASDDARTATLRIGGIAGTGPASSAGLVGFMACRASPRRSDGALGAALVALAGIAIVRRRRRRRPSAPTTA